MSGRRWCEGANMKRDISLPAVALSIARIPGAFDTHNERNEFVGAATVPLAPDGNFPAPRGRWKLTQV